MSDFIISNTVTKENICQNCGKNADVKQFTKSNKEEEEEKEIELKKICNKKKISSPFCCCNCHSNKNLTNSSLESQVSKVLEEISSSTTDKQSDDQICRICLDSVEEGTLIAPCKCSGTTKYAHEKCLLQWFFRSSNKSCEVCLGDVNVTPIGYKPMQEWRLPERSCDFIVYLFGLYFVIMILFTGMITWIATQGCSSPVCVTLYVVCGIAFLYFFYCCGCVDYSQQYWRSLLSVNRIWRIYGREDSIKNGKNLSEHISNTVGYKSTRETSEEKNFVEISNENSKAIVDSGCILDNESSNENKSKVLVLECPENTKKDKFGCINYGIEVDQIVSIAVAAPDEEMTEVT